MILPLIALALADAALVNRRVEQALDPFQAYTRQSFHISVENTGDVPEQSYTFLVPRSRHQHLALIRSKDASKDEPNDMRLGESPSPDLVAYDIVFEEPIAPGAQHSFGVLLGYMDGSTPLPASGRQSSEQYMVHHGLRIYPSVYHTDVTELKMAMLTDDYELLDSEPDTPKKDPEGFLIFGPFGGIPPLGAAPMVVRFANPSPQLRVERLERKLWVSHWGNTISFDDSYDLFNAGTKLEGPFSRSQFQHARSDNSLNTAAIRALRLPLPEGHREEYYVDLVGNVSTSMVQDGIIDLIPRYPVMGGWFYNFTVGFASDLANFVHSPSSGNYILEVPLIAGPHLASYSEVNLKIVLPEGASNVELISENRYESKSEYTTYSYLDLFGRPTLDVTFKNVVFEMGSDSLLVTYHYTLLTALRKPLAYVSAAFAVLVAAKALRRI